MSIGSTFNNQILMNFSLDKGLNINKLLLEASKYSNLELIKFAIENGANNKTYLHNARAISYSMGNIDIATYIDDYIVKNNLQITRY